MNVYRSLFIWLLIGLMVILLFNLLNAPKKTQEEMIFSDLLTKLDAGQIDEVTIKENAITGRLKDGTKFKSYYTEYPDLVTALRAKNVKITVKPPDQTARLKPALWRTRTIGFDRRCAPSARARYPHSILFLKNPNRAGSGTECTGNLRSLHRRKR